VPSHMGPDHPYPFGAAMRRIVHCGRSAACVALLASLGGIAQDSRQPPGGALRTDKVNLPTPINQPPDANAQLRMLAQMNKEQNYTVTNEQRRKQIVDDTVKLLKLASDLKSEIESTGKSTLSLNVIRKADEIEKLAHSVKERMKLTVGMN
jgi:hypothetical protein